MNILEALALAQKQAKLSTCWDKQVGCVLLTNKGQVVSSGFNKVLGMDSCDKCQPKFAPFKPICPVVHAEMNALINAVKAGRPGVRPEVAVCTLEPCIECTKALALAGIKDVYYERFTNPNKSGRMAFETLVPNGKWRNLSENYASYI